VQNVVYRAVNKDILGDIMFYEFEPGIADQVRDVIRIAGYKIVHAYDVVTLFDEPVTEMAAEKSCPAGYQCAHSMVPPCPLLF
jgi:hypothetical protein